MTEQRRLAAILVADVVGYSKLIGSDEAGTLAQLQVLRTEVIEPQIAKHAGRLFKSVGDGFLIEFASAVQAVSCAKAIQEANDQGRLPLRIGIHVGDVVIQGDDLMGDGVNVAARVESIAEPGGIAITRAVHEQVRDKLDLGFMDKGEIELKNVQRPVQVFVIGGKEVGRRLGVRYVLEGSVRKASGKVRIAAQLIDAMTGTHLWGHGVEHFQSRRIH